MLSYHLKEESEAENQLEINSDKMESANKANRTSDTYVLLTVLFAGVLFFAGIASTIQSKLVRNVSLMLSAIIFLVTLFVLFGMPVASVG
jgi:ABC-type multidrug transport system fused ATPase/permease subunit